MTTNKTPGWAIDLVEQVCKDYKRALPKELVWYSSPHRHYTGGTYWRNYNRNWWAKKGITRIFIRAGLCTADQRLVLLHELAHHITNKRKSTGHTAKFWHLAFELYDKYDVGIDKAYEREKHYKKYATVAYQKALAKK